LATILEGQVIEGGWVSFTVTVKEQPLVLPELSIATQFTSVTPLAKVEPEGGVHTTVTPGQLSVAVAANVTFEAVHSPRSVERTILAGQTIDGGWVSLTVTEKEQPFVFPEASVATHFTIVTPFVNVDPEGGVHTTVAPGQLSDTSVANVTFETVH
jgi:hypothetical protein